MIAHFYDARNIKKKQEMEKKTKDKKEIAFKKSYAFKNSELYSRGPEGYEMVQFFSKAKDKNYRYLSTLQRCDPPLQIDGKTYPSVEHWFQSQKYPQQYWHLFQTGGEIKEPKQAKKAGSKGGMAKYNLTLDLNKWNGMCKSHPNEFHRIRVMKKGLWARFKQDKRFRDILCTPFTYFVHYEKKRGRYDPKRIPAWGSYKSKLGGWSGLNVLGLLYMELARFHNIEGWLGDTKVNWSIKVWSSGKKPMKAWEKSHPLIPHRALTPRKEWKYGGFVIKESVHMDASIILHC